MGIENSINKPGFLTSDGIPSEAFRFTLCFLTWGDRILMLHRNKPPNQGLWNGVGGKIQAGETPLLACLREVYEETGYSLQSLNFGGLLTWKGFEIPPGGIYLFFGEVPEYRLERCSEGELAWKPRSWVFSASEVVSNIHVFLPIMLNGGQAQQFHFVYEDGIIQSYRIGNLPAWELDSISGGKRI